LFIVASLNASIPVLKLNEKVSFEQGITSDETDYTIKTYLSGSGNIMVKTNNFNRWGIKVPSASDGIKFLIVDGSNDIRKAFYKRKVNVISGKTYVVSWDEATNEHVKISLFIDNKIADEGGAVVNRIKDKHNGGNWHTRWTSFVATKTGTVIVKLKLSDQRVPNNDFAFDNFKIEKLESSYIAKVPAGAIGFEVEGARGSHYWGKDLDVLTNGIYKYTRQQDYDVGVNQNNKLVVRFNTPKQLSKIKISGGDGNYWRIYSDELDIVFYNSSDKVISKQTVGAILTREKQSYFFNIPKNIPKISYFKFLFSFL